MTMNAEKIKVAGSFKALGHVLSGERRRAMEGTRRRMQKAMRTIRWVRRVKMPSRKQKAEGAMGLAMPRAAYGAWLTRKPIQEKGPLATSMMAVAWSWMSGACGETDDP